MEIFKLFGSILVENDPANKAIDETDKKGKGLAGTLGTVTKGAAVVGAAAIATGAAMFGAAKKASDYASELNDMSVRSGIGTDKLQELKYMAEMTGVNFDTVTGAVGKLTKQMAAAQTGNEAAAGAFAGLNVEIKNSDGSLKSMDDVFPQVLSKLADMKNETERNALAMQLFGKGGMELVPMLAGGSASIEEMAQKAKDLGLIMDENTIAMGDTFGDTLDTLKSSLGMVGMSIGAEFMPIIQRLMDWVLKNMPAIRKGFGEAFAAIGEILAPVVKAFQENLVPTLVKLYEWVKPSLPAIKGFFKAAFEDIALIISAVFKTIDWFIDRCENIYNWAKKVIDVIKKMETALRGGATPYVSGAPSGRAIGGPVSAGTTYLVGEQGPELFTPSQSGGITPNNKLGGITININGAMIMDDYGVDRMMDRIMERGAALGMV